MATRRRIAGDIEREIAELGDLNYTPAQIERELRQTYKDERAEDVPNLRTIQRIVAARRRDDPSGTWHLLGAPGEDARVLMPVIAWVILASKGEKTSLTKAEARAIVAILRVAPDALPVNAYYQALEYLRAVRDGDDARLLAIEAGIAFATAADARLKFISEETPQGWFEVGFEEALDRGWVPGDREARLAYAYATTTRKKTKEEEDMRRGKKR